MKKIILFISAILILVTSCGEKDEFKIVGKLPNAEYDGRQVYLQTLAENWKDRVNLDTATIENGVFGFKGLAKEGPTIHFVVLAEPSEKINRPVLVILEPGQIDITFDSISSIKGTVSNNNYQAYKDKLNGIEAEQKAIFEKGKQDTANLALQAELEKQYEEKDALKTSITYEYAKANIKNQIGVYVFTSFSYMFSLEQMKKLQTSIDTKFAKNERVIKLEKRIAALEATAVDKMFTDAIGKTPEGKDISLSDYAGKEKYVLVDFWASWCPPCRAEMPKLVEAYKQYKDKGFEIVGISLDSDNEAWKKGIKNLGITWPQISDLKGWDNAAAGAYGVNSIPHLMLLDKDGKIIARGLSGDEVGEKLKELFSK